MAGVLLGCVVKANKPVHLAVPKVILDAERVGWCRVGVGTVRQLFSMDISLIFGNSMLVCSAGSLLKVLVYACRRAAKFPFNSVSIRSGDQNANNNLRLKLDPNTNIGAIRIHVSSGQEATLTFTAQTAASFCALASVLAKGNARVEAGGAIVS